MLQVREWVQDGRDDECAERRLTVSGCGKLVPRRIGALLVSALRPNRSDHGRVCKILTICFRGIRIIAASPNIVNVEIRLLCQGALDALVTDIIGADAGGVAPRTPACLQRGNAFIF